MKKTLRNFALALLTCGAFSAYGQVQTVNYVYDVDPAPGSAISGFAEGSVIKFKLTEDAPPVFTMRFYDGDGEFWGEWYSHQNQFTQENGYYVHEFLTDFVFEEGNTYDVVFNFYPNALIDEGNLVGTQQISYTGTSRAQKSSTVLLSVVPVSPGEITLDADGGATVTMTFSAPVTIEEATVPLGMGVGLPGTAKPANDEETIWTVNIPAEYVEETVSGYDRLMIAVYVLDSEGKYLYENGLPYFSLDYTLSGITAPKGTDFYVDIEGKTLQAPVDSFVVSSGNENLPIAPNDANLVVEENGVYVTINPYTSIAVTDASGTVMSNVESVFYTDDDGEHMLPFDGTVTLTNPITEPGTYTIHFPYMAFHIGEETLATYSMEKTVDFIISGTSASLMEEATVLNPETETVGSLMLVQLTWDKQSINLNKNAKVTVNIAGEVTYDCELATTLYNEDQEPGIARMVDEGNNILNIYLPFEAFGKTGSFVIDVPEGTVSNFDGVANPAQLLAFYVAPYTQEAMTVTPECGNFGTTTVDRLTDVTVSWNGRPIAFNNGVGLRLGFGDTQYYIYNEGLVTLDENDTTVVMNVSSLVKENGQYEIVLPDGAFLIGEGEEMSLSQEAVFTYIVTDYSGIDSVVVPQDGRYMVYDLNGMLVLDTDSASALRTLAPGLYVINGRKVVLK